MNMFDFLTFCVRFYAFWSASLIWLQLSQTWDALVSWNIHLWCSLRCDTMRNAMQVRMQARLFKSIMLFAISLAWFGSYELSKWQQTKKNPVITWKHARTNAFGRAQVCRIRISTVKCDLEFSVISSMMRL